MESPSTGVGDVIIGPNADDDTAQMDKMCEKALAASKNGRYTLAAGFFHRVSETSSRQHGETFVSAFLALQSSNSLLLQSALPGVTCVENASLLVDAWALASTTLPLIKRRMEDNTMLPGRGTAVETAFFKTFTTTSCVVFSEQMSSRHLLLAGLSLGYATAVAAVSQALESLRRAYIGLSNVEDLKAFVLCVVDCMLPVSRTLKDFVFVEEHAFAYQMNQLERGLHAAMDPAFLAALHHKWTTSEMVAMRRARGLDRAIECRRDVDNMCDAVRRADIAAHGPKECALPSCGKREASVGQHKRCSACRSAWYCSAEHGLAHWKEHKPACRATVATKQAAADGLRGGMND